MCILAGLSTNPVAQSSEWNVYLLARHVAGWVDIIPRKGKALDSRGRKANSLIAREVLHWTSSEGNRFQLFAYRVR